MSAFESLKDLDYGYKLDVDTDIHLWCSIALSFISWFILLPLVIYHSNRYFLNRNSIILKKRYANITMFESILLCIKLFIVPIGFYFFFSSISTNIIWIIIWNFSHFCAISLYWCWILRFWLLMYDIKWTLAIANNQWQQIINPHYKDKKLNWYLRNKKTFGQQKYIQYRIILPIIIISTLIIWSRAVITMIYDENSFDKTLKWQILFYTFMISQGIATILPLISLLIIRCKLPNSYHDNFYIISELQRIFICVFIDEVIFLIILFYFNFDKEEISDDIKEIITATEILLIDFFQWFAVIIATFWVNRKIMPIIQYKRYEIRKSSATHYQPLVISGKDDAILSLYTNEYNNNNNGYNGYNNNNNYNGMSSKIKLINVLNRKKTFEIFMQHLSSELSLEHCVCLVELLQFRECVNLYIKYHNIKLMDNNSRYKTKSILNYIHFPKDIPLSEIVFNIDIYDLDDDNDENSDYDATDDDTSSNDDSSSDGYNYGGRKRKNKKENSMGNSTILLNHIDNDIINLQRNNGIINNDKEKYLKFDENKFIAIYKVIAYKLYIKYLNIGSEYDIGIDELIRNEIQNMLNMELTLYNLLHLFDLACIEIYGLLKKSFKRFKATAQWKKMKQCVSIQ